MNRQSYLVVILSLFSYTMPATVLGGLLNIDGIGNGQYGYMNHGESGSGRSLGGSASGHENFHAADLSGYGDSKEFGDFHGGEEADSHSGSDAETNCNDAEFHHLGTYIEKHQLPPKVIRIVKTVAVKVPVPYPVKIPHPVPHPVPIAKPYPVHVPKIVKIKEEILVPLPIELHSEGNNYGIGTTGDDSRYGHEHSETSSAAVNLNGARYDTESDQIHGGLATGYEDSAGLGYTFKNGLNAEGRSQTHYNAVDDIYGERNLPSAADNSGYNGNFQHYTTITVSNVGSDGVSSGYGSNSYHDANNNGNLGHNHVGGNYRGSFS